MYTRSAPNLRPLDITDPSLDRLHGRIASALPNGVLVVDASGRITFANAEIQRQFGYDVESLLGQPVDTLLPESILAVHGAHRPALLAEASARPTGAGRHLFGRRRDGSEFPVEIGLNPVTTEHGSFVLAVVVDISARRQAEDQQRRAVEEQLDFERLVAELSSRFINLPADRVDAAVFEAFGRVCSVLDLDRATCYRLDPDGYSSAAIGWHRDGIELSPGRVNIREDFPFAYETLVAGRVLSFATLDDLPNPKDRSGFGARGVQSSVTVPLSVDGRVIGAVGFNSVRMQRSWPPDVLHRLRVFATAFGNLLARRESETSLHRALDEVKQLKDQLQAENVYLRSEVRERLGTGAIVGESAAIRRVLEQVDQVAATNSTVLLLGETGTGKELFATRIHELSARKARAMVRVNCAAIPATLMESELFGREKGAFTGALARQIGRFELADSSSIFLDEIGDVPSEVQVKLLRVLEERQIERLGSPKAIKVDTRVIAATHRNLEVLIANGTFREDLYYRLNVFPIQVPPLRERPEDIPLLVWRFVDEFSRAFGKPIRSIPREDMAALTRYSWPGNIRELRNVIERAMIVATPPRLRILLPTAGVAAGKRSDRLVDVEAEHMRRVLESCAWRIRGAGGAADRLGLRPTTLETRMAKLGIKRPARP